MLKSGPQIQYVKPEIFGERSDIKLKHWLEKITPLIRSLGNHRMT